MGSFVIRAISRDVTTEVRRTLRAPEYGHPVHRELARGTGPCRECLTAFRVGEEDRLLFTFNPFADGQHLPQPGPVFIHADDCEPTSGNADDVYPGGLLGVPVLVEAHYADGTTSAPGALMVGHEVQTLRGVMLESRVSFLHLRHAEAGCFIARVERVPHHH